MKWLIKTEPREGTIRMVKRFAWFPIVVEGYNIWLERYNSYERYTSGYFLYPFDGNPYKVSGRWYTSSRTLI